MADLVEEIAVAIVVLGAAVYLVLRFSGLLERWRSRSKPDVPVSKLVRRKSEPRACDRCDR